MSWWFWQCILVDLQAKFERNCNPKIDDHDEITTVTWKDYGGLPRSIYRGWNSRSKVPKDCFVLQEDRCIRRVFYRGGTRNDNLFQVVETETWIVINRWSENPPGYERHKKEIVDIWIDKADWIKKYVDRWKKLVLIHKSARRIQEAVCEFIYRPCGPMFLKAKEDWDKKISPAEI